MSRLLLRRMMVLLACAALLDPLFAQNPPPPFAPLPQPPVPPANPQTPAKVALGTALFWDEQLSRTGTVACGSCHMPQAGGSDPRTRQPNAASVHPGPDQLFNTADDIVGSIGVPRHAGDGIYLFDPLFGMAPQVGTRQTQTAINSAYPPLLFWDGRAGGSFVDPDSQQQVIALGGALENQALGPIVNSVEMAHVGGTLADIVMRVQTARPLRLSPALPQPLSQWIAGRGYPELFAEVFGTPEVSSARIAMALASYQRSLVSNQTPHDLQLAGQQAMSQAELAGRQDFVQAGCARCHGGPELSNNAFLYIGVRPQGADPGRFAVTGNNGDRGRMRTPPLRNIELSAPYMADGRFRTLEEVVDFYNRGGDFNAPNKDPRITPLGLTAQQRAGILTFLRRPLTDPRVRDETGPFARPLLYAESTRVPQRSTPGMPGLNGAVPRLTAIEAPILGGLEFTIGVDGGRGLAQALAVLALEDPDSVQTPALLSRGLTLSSLGAASVDLALPGDRTLLGQTLYLRVFVVDPAAFDGWSATQSVRFELLDDGELLLASGFEG